MNFDKYTIKTQQTIQQAINIAQGNGQQIVDSGHLLKALLESKVTPTVLSAANNPSAIESI